MAQFVRVASVTELASTDRLLVEVDDRIVALLKINGDYFCLDDVCTHDGGPLSEGRLENHAIACPRHGAKFDVRTGKALTMPATVDTAAHEVKVDGENILVRLCEPGELKRSESLGVQSPTAAPAIAAPGQSSTAAVDQPAPMPAKAADLGSASHSSGELHEDLVREELKKVIDPELFINIVDLGLIYNVDLVPGAEGKTNCKIDMTMTSPMCPAGPQLIANSKQILAALPGMGEVEVKIVLDPPWTPDKMTQDARDQLGIF